MACYIPSIIPKVKRMIMVPTAILITGKKDAILHLLLEKYKNLKIYLKTLPISINILNYIYRVQSKCWNKTNKYAYKKKQ
tara:strand:+ start:166 stop:405 length:240 start_codon:yes stop_codon:yes gene_type:complete